MANTNTSFCFVFIINNVGTRIALIKNPEKRSFTMKKLTNNIFKKEETTITTIVFKIISVIAMTIASVVYCRCAEAAVEEFIEEYTLTNNDDNDQFENTEETEKPKKKKKGIHIINMLGYFSIAIMFCVNFRNTIEAAVETAFDVYHDCKTLIKKFKK